MYTFPVYCSSVTIPFSLGVHTWVVLDFPDGTQKRYEVHSVKNKKTNSYLYINQQPREEGMPLCIIPYRYVSKKTFRVLLLYSVSGDIAQSIIETIEKNLYSYPYFGTYRMVPGPNSNTFTRWLLDQHPHTSLWKLPWNAFGERYARFFKK